MLCVRAEDALAAAAAAAAASDKMRSVNLSVPLPPSTSALSLALQFAGTLRQIQSCSKLAPFFSWSARVQGRLDPEGGAEDGRRRQWREEVQRFGARGERRRDGELLWGAFFFSFA
jgi:hypothetical protein